MLKKISSLSFFDFLYVICLFFLIFISIILYVYFLLHSAEFYYDEASLFLNIKNKSYFSLLFPLDFQQAAPPLYLFLSKLLYSIFGFNEFILRLPSTLIYIFSIIFIPFLSHKIFKYKYLSLIFIVFFLFNIRHAVYSQTFKHYSFEVFISLLLIYLFIFFREKIYNKKNCFFVSLIFSICSLFSFSSNFLIISALLCFIRNLTKKSMYSNIFYLLSLYTITTLFEFFCLKNNLLSNNIGGFWQSFTIPFAGFDDFLNYLSFLISDFISPYFLFLIILVSIIVLFVKDKSFLFFLLFPFFIHSCLNYWGLYPFPSYLHFRLLLYSSPILLILLLTTFDYIITNLKYNFRNIFYFLFFSILLFISTCSFYAAINDDKYVRDNNNYYFVKSDVKHFVEMMYKSNVNDNDLIAIDTGDYNTFILYDLNNKYTKKLNNINYSDFLMINGLQKDLSVWFFYSKLRYTKIQYNRFLYFLKQNYRILSITEDDWGYLIYAKKINE